MEPSVFFPPCTFPSVLYFATITRPLRHTACWRTAVPWDANVISLEILMRARGGGGGLGGDEPRLDLAWGWRVGRNEGWAVYLRRRFSVFLPLAICRHSRDAYQAHRFPEESRLSSHLSPVYPPSSGAFPETPWCPVAGISSLREIISSLY